MDDEMTFEKESDSIYNSNFVRKSNTREKLTINEESSEKSGASSI